MTAPLRLNLGCGPVLAPGWVNADRLPRAGLDVCADFLEGLPLPDGAAACVVAMHVLQDLGWQDVPVGLQEIRRVLAPGGVLRLGVPDLDRAIDAYRRGDAEWFLVPDEDAGAPGAKLVTQLVWYGSVRTPFTFDFARESLLNAGFREPLRCAFGETRHGDAHTAELDNRERESLFVEALK